MSLVLSNKGKGMQSSSEQPLVGEERYVTTRITAAKETKLWIALDFSALDPRRWPRGSQLWEREWL